MSEFEKNREFQYNGNNGQRRDDRSRDNNRNTAKNSHWNNDNNRSQPNAHSHYPSYEKCEEHTSKSKMSMKDEIFEMIDADDLNADAKAMCLALLHVANKIEHVARVVEGFTRKIEEMEKNEKARENASKESGSTKVQEG